MNIYHTLLLVKTFQSPTMQQMTNVHHVQNIHNPNTNPNHIEEENATCVFASKSTHMTRNLRHLDLADSWIESKVADGFCLLIKIDSKNNHSDIGTKRVSQSLFNALTHSLVDRQLRDNL